MPFLLLVVRFRSIRPCLTAHKSLVRYEPVRTLCYMLPVRVRTPPGTSTRTVRLQIMLCGLLVNFVILSLHILCRFLCVICTSAQFNEPLLCVCSSVRRSQGDVARRHESSRVLFVTLNKSETYKETIVLVLLLLLLLVRTAIAYGVQYTVQYRLCFVVGWGRLPDFVTFAKAILGI